MAAKRSFTLPMYPTLNLALFAGLRTFSSRRLRFKRFFTTLVCAVGLISKIERIMAMGALINKIFPANWATANYRWLRLCTESTRWT
jgi:uncharacterized membrane protein